MTSNEKNDKLLEVLLSRTNAERQSIVRNYQKLFNKSILLEIPDINMQSMKLFIQDMLTDTSMLLADELNKAMKTSDLQLVTSILIDFWGDEFNQVESVYRIYTNKSIWQHINNSFGVTVKNILRCTVMTRKHELKLDNPIKEKVKTTGKDLSAFIENNTNGLMRDVLIAMLNHSVNKPMYFATIIHDAIHKNQTNTSTVHRLLISRSEIDLYTINKEYKVKYGKYLLDDVKKTFDGIYGKFLAKLLQNKNYQNLLAIDTVVFL
ncbi:Annexin A10 [Schistosoma japonicum]|uniref:Annexin A10 n=1 Tax=Schistosoma japonicum TaxID=6182 RepID=A0A4Z2D725_SCHJA|nr:Annexin A10 [Schistosoma japonicum]